MVSINYSAREVCCKIVYYGPGLSGKTTNLQYVHSKVPNSTRGDLISLATEADRTLYFDFLPINIGTINGFQAKFQLYTVPGQVYYNATRKLVLRGVDGVVFVADSQPDKMDENVESLCNLVDNLQEYGYDLNELPMVIQYNKRDLPNIMSVEEMNNRINTRNLPVFEASATLGNGVFDTLKMIIKLVLEKAKSTAVTNRPSSSISGSANRPAAPAPTPPTPEQQAPAPTPPTPAQQAPAPTPPTPAQQAPAPTPPAPAQQAPASASFVDQVPQRVNAPAAQTASSEPPEPAKMEERIPTYRPYPGSAGGPEAASSPQQPQIDRPYPGMENQGTPVNEHNQNIDIPAEATGSVGHVPTMAPPLRRRGGSKKRGFFRKLFGIK